METRYNRRQFLKGLGALVAGTALAVSNPLAYSAEPKPTPVKEEEVWIPYFAFKLTLGDKYDSDKDKELKKYYGNLSNKGKKNLFKIYLNPEDFLRENFKDKKIIEEIKAYKLSDKRIEEIKKEDGFIWKVNTEKPDLSDKIFFYINDIIVPAQTEGFRAGFGAGMSTLPRGVKR